MSWTHRNRIVMPSPARLLRVSAYQKLEVLSHHRNVNQHVEAAFAGIEAGDFTQMKQHLVEIERGLLGFEKYLSTTIEPEYYAEHRQPSSETATKAFNIPELLENILQNLGVVDVMRCYAMNRAFRDTIENSTKLQTSLFLHPAPQDEPVRVPFDFQSFSCTIYPQIFPHNYGTISVTIRAEADEDFALPTIGSRWKRMLVRQPPVRKMHYRIECSHKSVSAMIRGPAPNPEHRSNHIIVSEEGLTVHDLYEAAKTLIDEHRDCPFGDGWKWKHVIFSDPKDIS